jgi:hypothetical protein
MYICIFNKLTLFLLLLSTSSGQGELALPHLPAPEVCVHLRLLLSFVQIPCIKMLSIAGLPTLFHKCTALKSRLNQADNHEQCIFSLPEVRTAVLCALQTAQISETIVYRVWGQTGSKAGKKSFSTRPARIQFPLDRDSFYYGCVCLSVSKQCCAGPGRLEPGRTEPIRRRSRPVRSRMRPGMIRRGRGYRIS